MFNKSTLFTLLLFWSSINLNAQSVLNNQRPVSFGTTNAQSSLDPVNYTWTNPNNDLQGVAIFLPPATTPNTPNIYFQQNNGRFSFNLGGSEAFSKIEVKYDNGSYTTVFQANNGTPPRQNYGWVSPPAGFKTLGSHTLTVKYTTVLGAIRTRNYNVFVVEDADEFHHDAVSTDLFYRNKLTLWEGANASSQKVVLLVSGFDAYNTKPAAFYRWQGDLLFNDLIALDYKVYVLTFAFNGQDLRRNAAVTHSAVEYISNLNNNNDIIVAGVSMGGVISRYALTKDEDVQNALPTPNYLPVSHYVSLDGPQQGAVISEELMDFTHNNDASNYTFNTEAFKTLVRNNYKGAHAAVHNSFYNELANLNGGIGYPTHCLNIGVAFSNPNLTNPDAGIKWLDVDANLHIGGASLFPVKSHSDKVSNEEVLPGSQLPLNTGAMNDVFTGWGFLGVITNRSGIVHPTFIPHFSALDISNNQSKFCLTIYPENNQSLLQHDEIPSQIIKPLIDVLESQNLSNIPASTTYNYTKNTPKHILNNIDVFGTMAINKNTLSGFNNSPVGGVPNAGSKNTIETNSCDGVQIKVYSGAALEVGDQNGFAEGGLLVKRGSSLSLKSGSFLKLAENSKLVIEEGANLIIEDNVDIALNGTNSELVIQGKLTVAPNTNFTFRGSGKLVFDQNIPWVTNAQGNLAMDLTNFMEIGANATFKLSNPSPADKYDVLLECRQPALLKDALGNAFTEVEITNGTVALEQDAFIFSFGKTDVVDARITNTGNNAKHGGLRVWNSGNVNRIRRTEVSQGHPGILYHGFGASGRIEVIDCDFSYNLHALRVDGGNFRFNQNDANHSIGRAIDANAISGTSYIGGNNFLQTGTNFYKIYDAVELVGQQGSMLHLSNNHFTGFAKALDLDNVDLLANCNTIEQNSIGIQSDNGLLFLNEEASNTFKLNDAAHLDLMANASGHGLYLRGGFNSFKKSANASATFAHITANFHCYFPLGDYLPGGTILDVNYNKFEILPVQQGQVNLFPMQIEYCTNPNQYFNLNVDYAENNNSTPLCNSQNPTGFEGHVLHSAVEQFSGFGGKVSSPGYFTDYPLVAGLQEAIDSLSLPEQEGNDHWALEQFNAILTGTLSVNNVASEGLLNIAYQGAFMALNNAYTNGALQHNGEEFIPKPDVLINLENIVQGKINALDATDSADHNLVFKYNLDKVQAARVGGYYADALNRLAQNNWQFNYTQSQRKGYWECVCEAENEYYQGALPEEEFAYELQACRTTFAGYAYKRAQTQAPKTLHEMPQALQVFPQPVKSDLNVQLTKPFNGEVTISVRSTSGALAFNETYQWQGAAKTLSLAGLAPGVYLLEFTSKEYHEVVKLIKK